MKSNSIFKSISHSLSWFLKCYSDLTSLESLQYKKKDLFSSAPIHDVLGGETRIWFHVPECSCVHFKWSSECNVCTLCFNCSLIYHGFWIQINPFLKFCRGRSVFQEWCKNAGADCNKCINPKRDCFHLRWHEEILSNCVEKSFQMEKRK